MHCRHDIEALIYFLIEMTTGTLPWADIGRDKIPLAKKNAIEDKSLFRNCPPALVCFTSPMHLTDRWLFSL